MIRRALSRSVKVLKISTWIGAIVALLIVLIVGFFVAFPAFIKTPIEQQLSSVSGLDIKLSKITFDLKEGNIALRIHDVDIASIEDQQSLILIENLHWQLDWLNIFDDVRNPSKVYIDTLNIYSGMTDFNMADIKSFVTPEVLSALELFKTVNIDKTSITGDYNFELMPLVLSIDKTQLKLNIAQQMFGGKAFNISATFPRSQMEKFAELSLPVTIDGEDFKLVSMLKMYHEQGQVGNPNGQDFLEFKGVAQRMNLVDVSQYLPASIVGQETSDWLNQAFIAGELNNINIDITQNLSAQTLAPINFTAHLSDAKLLFDTQWPTLKQLDAMIKINGKRLDIEVNSSVLNNIPLNNIHVAIRDMTGQFLDAEVAGKFSTQSEQLIEFLKTTPLRNTTTSIPEQFTLSGELLGVMNLIIPLDSRQPIIEVDLRLLNNRLTVLDGDIVVEDFDSVLGFHNNTITTQGSGNIRNRAFDIRVNPSDRANNQDSLFAVELIDQQNKFNTYISQQSKQLWRTQITSEVLQTEVEIVLNDNNLPRVTLLDLKIATLDKIKGNWHFLPSDLPSMYLKSKGIYVDDYQLPDFKVELHSGQKILNINNLEFDGIGIDQHNLSFDGNWLNGITTLVTKARGERLADFLEKLGVEEQVEGGQFDIDVRLFCQCEPWNINLQNISGYMAMKVQQGVFTDQDPNIGRLLSLLNIQSIARRLKLQMSDLTSKGFAYDKIQASVYLKDSLAKIDNFELSASSSDIRLTGHSNIVDKQYNLSAKVRPAISDSVPIATYLAGGGLAGLGVWVVDKFLFDGKVMNAVVDTVAEFEYKITGSWDNPVIK